MAINFMPKEVKFFDYLNLQGENLVKATGYFRSILKNGVMDEAAARKIHDFVLGPRFALLEIEAQLLDARAAGDVRDARLVRAIETRRYPERRERTCADFLRIHRRD